MLAAVDYRVPCVHAKQRSSRWERHYIFISAKSSCGISISNNGMERRVIPCEKKKKLRMGLLPWEEGTWEGWSQEAVAEWRVSLQVLRVVLCVGPGVNKALIELRTGQLSVGRSQPEIKHLLLLSASQKSLFTLRNTKTKRNTDR